LLLADSLLDSYAGDYRRGANDVTKVRRLSDGQLSLTVGGAEVVLTAASPTHFYAAGTDVQVKFDFTGPKKKILITVGEPFERAMVAERVE
jgi:hypothetical protein